MVIYPLCRRDRHLSNRNGVYTGIPRSLILIHEKAVTQTRDMGRRHQGLGEVHSAPFHARQPQHWLLPCILPRDHISQLLFWGLFSASFICTLLFQGEAPVSNGSPTGVGGQHRARHMGNRGTELTLPVAGIGRGLQAGTHGIATTWPPPLPCRRQHAEQKFCTQRDYSVWRKMWRIKGNELDRHIHQLLFWIWMPQFQSINVRNIRALILNRLLLPVL